MSEFTIRSDSVDVEEIMRRVRARVAEKQGAPYTEQDVQQMAAARLETFFDPQKVRSDLIEEIRRVHMDPNAELGDETLFGSSKPWLRRIRRLLRPVLKLFINTTPLVHASMVRNGDLFAELVHNLVVETTRLNLELKSLKMRVESLASRLDFDERRARALEGVVQYRPADEPAAALGEDEDEGDAAAQNRPRRRRRRRGRRGPGQQGGTEQLGPDVTAGGGEHGRVSEREGAANPADAPASAPRSAGAAEPRGAGVGEDPSR
jgi:hypothetical protein